MTGNLNTKPFEILLVEDNPGDVRLTQEALKDVEAATNVTVVGNGDAAVGYLRREGEYAEAGRPEAGDDSRGWAQSNWAGDRV